VVASEQQGTYGLDEQARLLADWALETWKLLDDDPLPEKPPERRPTA
jgi:hypothetical protein